MATPVEEPERQYHYEGSPPDYSSQPPPYTQPGHGESIEMQTYPPATHHQQPPPPYMQGNGRPAPIAPMATRTMPLRAAGMPAPVPQEPTPETSREPLDMTCPHCGLHGVTETRHKVGSAARRAACYLALGCCIPCMFIPLCKDSMKDVEHYCGHCKQFLGKWIKPNEVKIRPEDKVKKRKR